jgi:hypothetical protein
LCTFKNLRDCSILTVKSKQNSHCALGILRERSILTIMHCVCFRRSARDRPPRDAGDDRAAAAGGGPGEGAAQAGGLRQDHRRDQGVSQLPPHEPRDR